MVKRRMIKRVNEVNSFDELKASLFYSDEDQNVQLAKGLEEFAEYVFQHGDEMQKFSVGYVHRRDNRPYAGHPPTGSVKTMIYALPNNSLLLCLLDMERLLDKDKVAQLYSPGNKLQMASLDDLTDLGMVKGGCHGFPSPECQKDWKVVVDNGICMHPIYIDGTSKNLGALLAGPEIYTEIMQARFPGRIAQEEISEMRK